MGFQMKPCPFCGAAGEHLLYLFDNHFRDGKPTGNVHCKPCASRGPRGAGQEAIDLWNAVERKFRPIMNYWDKQK